MAPTSREVADLQRQREDALGRRVAAVIENNAHHQLVLDAVRVQGTKATRRAFLNAHIAPLLAPHLDGQHTDLVQVLVKARTLSHQLAQYGIYSHVHARLERATSVFAAPNHVDLVLSVKDLPRFYLRTATDIGNSEGSASATARIRNVFGGAEDLEANVAFGTRTRSSFQLRFSSPIPTAPNPLTRLELDAFAAERDLSYYASCRERLAGLHARFKKISDFGIHEVSYEAVHRAIADLEPYASMSIRKESGENIKSALSHTFTHDSRDNPFMATRGAYARLFSEYAGLGGDASHLKAEGEYSISRAIRDGFSLAFSLRTGVLYPLNGKRSAFSDRFHLGGPTSIRLFRPNSIGPRDNSDYLGGNAVWSAGISAFTPLFYVPSDWPLKGHFWFNFGKLSSPDYTTTTPNLLNSLFSQPVSTAGVGLIYQHTVVRVEANVGLPIAAAATDGYQKGFQFGLGISFL